jgi:hypothetical protein
MQGKTIVPSKYSAARSTWPRINPKFSIVLWDEVDLQNLVIGTHWEAVIQLCDTLIQRADVYRCAVLETYGGVYIDMDMHAIKPLEPLLQELDLCTEDVAVGMTSFKGSPLDYYLAINNAWISSRKGSSVWKTLVFPELLQRLHYKTVVDFLSPVYQVLRTAGPGAWTHLTRAHPSSFKTLPRDLFYSLRVVKGNTALSQSDFESLKHYSYAYHAQHSAWLTSWEYLILAMFIGRRWIISCAILALLILLFIAIKVKTHK